MGAVPDDDAPTVTLTDAATSPPVPTVAVGGVTDAPTEVVFGVEDLDFFYGAFQALRGVTLNIGRNEVTALIGPSGCGKSTFLRCLNRMNDLIPGTRVEGRLDYYGEALYDAEVSSIEVRRRIGMVFQKPNPFPKTIYDNIAFGPKVNGMKVKMNDLVEECLTRAALWDEVKDKLKNNGLSLSGGQQQRLCIARAIATEPSVLLMDEPCSALDPIATRRVEELMLHLKQTYTIAIVTHNMQQATRVADTTAFFSVDMSKGGRTGYLVEMGPTKEVFENPQQKLTKDYISGQFS